MNLFFRLIRILVTARLRPRVDMLAETSVFFRVWPTDLDVLRHMNNAKYCSIMDLGRVDNMIRNGAGKIIVDHGWYPVVAAEWIKFKESLTPFARFELRTQTLGWDDKSFYVRQIFYVGDRLAAVGLVRARFLAKTGGSVNASDIAERFAPGLESPPLPEYVRDWQAAEEHLIT